MVEFLLRRALLSPSVIACVELNHARSLIPSSIAMSCTLFIVLDALHVRTSLPYTRMRAVAHWNANWWQHKLENRHHHSNETDMFKSGQNSHALAEL